MNEIEEKINQLASNLILLDAASSEELSEFLDLLKSLQEVTQNTNLKSISEIIQITQDILPEIDSKDEDKVNGFFTHVVSSLQSLIKNFNNKENISSYALNFKKEIQSLFVNDGVSESAGIQEKLTEIQISMLPEFISDALSLLEEIESDLLDLEKNGSNAERINKIFRAFHTLKGEANLLGLMDLANLAHKAEDMLEKLRANIFSMDGNIVSILLRVVDVVKKYFIVFSSDPNQVNSSDFLLLVEAIESILIKKINNANDDCLKKEDSSLIRKDQDIVQQIDQQLVKKPIGEILIQEGTITPEELNKALHTQKTIAPHKRIGEILQESNAASAKDVQRAVRVQRGVVDTSIKIRVDKLDALIELVGELVISETQVVQNPLIRGIDNQRVSKDLADLDRITRRLQEISMGMRLVPVRPTFQKMLRIIRDLSRKSKKNIEATLLGEETEIDKNMVEMISDPLVHMVRNSVDHGIESKEERLQCGKSETGHIQLAAFHKGGNVVIEIRDDGAGLDVEKIFQKAVEKGLVNENDSLSNNRIYQLVFEPGFSTAEKVTDISGRGVGMDVVKRNIEQLRGKIDISSKKGEGSVFSIILPLTLAIIEGIILMVGNQRYILPISSVVEFVQPLKKYLTNIAGKGEMYSVHGHVHPILRLSSYFKAESCVDFEKGTLCLVESDYGRVCFLVDELLGQQQVVIKNLGEKLVKVKGVSGGAILGDGRVGLILDVNGIVELVQKGEV